MELLRHQSRESTSPSLRSSESLLISFPVNEHIASFKCAQRSPVFVVFENRQQSNFRSVLIIRHKALPLTFKSYSNI